MHTAPVQTEVPAPARVGRSDPTRRRADLVLAWAIGYGALRAWFASGHHPHFRPLPSDLVIFTGWGSVALVAAAGLVAVGLRTRDGWSRRWWLAACVVTIAMVGACALTLIDVVGTMLWGFGLPHSAVSAATRAGCLVGAGLLAMAAREHRRRWWADCVHCGRRGPVARWELLRGTPVPQWARVAAWVSVAGMATRFVAQVFLDRGATFFSDGASRDLFDAGFVLAGTVLPLALVHRWGRVVPRWIVALPALAISAGLVAYFGIATGQLLLEAVGLVSNQDDGYPASFLWVAVPAYFVWGLAMGAATLSYLRRTAPACRWCAR